MKIERHQFDQHQVEERFIQTKEDLPFFLDGARKDAKNLSLLMAEAMDAATCGSAVGATFEEVIGALRLAGQASAALFLTASRPLPVRVALGDGPRVLYGTRPDESTTHVSAWLRGFFLNTICRNSELIDTMCDVPADVLRGSSTSGPEYRYLFAEAVKVFWTGAEHAERKILDALEATDPHRTDVRKPDWTLNIDVPQLQLLFYISQRDDEFSNQLRQAVQLHKKYWSSETRQSDSDGLLAVELTALACLARDRKMSCEIASDYTPLDLIRGLELPGATHS